MRAFHPLANLFPMPTEEELQGMEQSIREHGQQDPIDIFEDMVLDGRGRSTACHRLGIAPREVPYTGSDPLGYVLAKNLHRRHLSVGQRAMIAAEIANMKEG